MTLAATCSLGRALALVRRRLRWAGGPVGGQKGSRLASVVRFQRFAGGARRSRRGRRQRGRGRGALFVEALQKAINGLFLRYLEALKVTRHRHG